MDMEEILFKMGVTTFVTDVITEIPPAVAPVAPQTEFQIGKILSTDVGFIYGLSTYADGLDAQNNPLITTTQAQGLWLTLQNGSTEFLETLRVSDLLNEFAGSPIVRPNKYTPVRIEAFDLSKSFYNNPNGFNSGFIHLKLWYIQDNVWEEIRTKHFKLPPRKRTVSRRA